MKGTWTNSRKALAVGGICLLTLIVLMTIGLTVGRKKGGETEEKKDLWSDVLIEEGDASSPEPGGGLQPVSTHAGEPASKQPESEERAGGTGQEMTAAGATAGALPPLPTNIIKTAEMSLEIESGEFNKTYSKVVLIAESSGGYVSDSRTDSTDGKISSGVITIRVPADSYSEVMTELKGAGEVTALSEQAQDVTEEFLDLEGRLNHLRAQEAFYLDLMSKAETTDEIISYQRELWVIQEQIEQILGRKNYLEDRVQFSAIQVTLLEPGEKTATGATWGFTQALSDAAHAVVDGASAVVRFLGSALVYVAIIAIIALVIYAVSKKLRRRSQPAT